MAQSSVPHFNATGTWSRVIKARAQVTAPCWAHRALLPSTGMDTQALGIALKYLGKIKAEEGWAGGRSHTPLKNLELGPNSRALRVGQCQPWVGAFCDLCSGVRRPKLVWPPHILDPSIVFARCHVQSRVTGGFKAGISLTWSTVPPHPRAHGREGGH